MPHELKHLLLRQRSWLRSRQEMGWDVVPSQRSELRNSSPLHCHLLANPAVKIASQCDDCLLQETSLARGHRRGSGSRPAQGRAKPTALRQSTLTPIPVRPSYRFECKTGNPPTPVARTRSPSPLGRERHAGGDYDEVDRLLARTSAGDEFLVQWAGESPEHDLWLPRDALMQDCPDLVLAMEAAWDALPPDPFSL
eukprot:613888-Rhodomonas_salina.1